MAKTNKQRLTRKYGKKNVENDKFFSLVDRIMSLNSETIEQALYERSDEKWKRYSKNRGVRLVFPDMEKVLSAEERKTRNRTSAKKISDTLKKDVVEKLRKTLAEHEGEKYVRRRGRTAGRINPELVTKFRKDLRDVFNDYTRNNPKLGMPANINMIATVEVRGMISNVKKTYAEKVKSSNPDLVFKKTWIHNPQLSEHPRRNHRRLNKRTVNWETMFKVITPKGDVIYMKYPHDPDAPIGEKAGCNCDYDIKVTRKIS